MKNLKELVEEVLYNKHKHSKIKVEDATIPSPQDFGAMALARKISKKSKKSKKTVEHKEISEAQEDELGKRLAWRYFWWVKKGSNYGLATFAARATRLAGGPTATSRDIPVARRGQPYISLYMKPLGIKWLVTDEEVEKSGAKEYYDYLKNNNLPLSLMLSRSALTLVMNEVDSFISRNIGDKDYDEYTPAEKKQLLDLEEQTISAMKELPIELDNRQLTKEEVNKIHDAMKSGHKTTTKYWVANLQKIIRNVDIPRIKAMAKKVLK